MEKPKIYIISGTLGAGKSTVAKLLAKKLQDSVLISADIFMDMLQDEKNPAWEERLKFMWENVICVAKNALTFDLDVVIEGVVEDEFPLLQEEFKDYEIHYHILVADRETLSLRIHERGDSDMVKRSMDVLSQLKKDPQKSPHLIDTSNRRPEEVVSLIMNTNPL